VARGLGHPRDRQAVLRPRPSRLFWSGLGAVALYVAVALWGPGIPAGIPLLFDGLGPPVPYRYVDPPSDLADDNLEPLEATGEIGLTEEGSRPTAVGTGDGQMQVIVPGDSFSPREDEELVVVQILPRALPADPEPGGDLSLVGNSYEVSAVYGESGEEAELRRDVTIVMRYPIHADELLRLDGSQWSTLESQRSEPSLQIFGDTDRLGLFASARFPEASRWWLPYLVAGLGVAAGILGFLWGRRGRAEKESN
jgi:hypothetical protein